LAATPALAAPPPEVAIQDVGDGSILTDAKGMSLYSFDMDKQPGKSACVGECPKAWPPLLAPAGTRPDQGWALIARDDGTSQWAYGGKPLYRYVVDSAPGDENGNGVYFNLWHVVFQPMRTPPGLTIHDSALGRVLADAQGRTLYVSDRSACDRACAEDWKPFPAPAIAGALGDWSAVRRDDGATQWAYKGKPLYRYARDWKAGATNGDGAVGAWHAAIVRPTPVLPPGMRYQASDLGRIVADSGGKSLYTLSESPNRPKVCDDGCIKANWWPFAAPSPALHPGLGWSVVKHDDGTIQWAYKGKLVYTFAGDEKPGDIRGDRFGNMSSGGFAPWEVIQPDF